VENVIALNGPPSGGLFFALLADQAAAIADGDGVGSAPCLQLCEQVPDVALDRFLGKEEPNPDLAIHETVGDELEDFDLTRRRLLLELRQRSLELDHLGDRVTASSDRFEPGRVLGVPRHDGVALCRVHGVGIDRVLRHL
jgi:hypothetical protein